MRLTGFLLIALTALSCNEATPVKPGHRYADLKGFFTAEIKRLSTQKQPVLKTVSRNQVQQTKLIQSVNWTNELNLFAESDINKPAWKDSYQTSGTPDNLSYSTRDTSLRTRSIRIIKNAGGEIRRVEIINRTANLLYQTDERLTYVTDSGYSIEKHQHVLMLGDNHYLIKGSFNK